MKKVNAKLWSSIKWTMGVVAVMLLCEAIAYGKRGE